MKVVDTFTATIYVGLLEVKLFDDDRYSGTTHSLRAVSDEVRKYVDEVGLCVTITETTFVYKNGSEPGVAVGLINYPRFPSPRALVEKHAMELARRLLKAAKQMRVSIVYPDSTVMLEAEDLVPSEAQV